MASQGCGHIVVANQRKGLIDLRHYGTAVSEPFKGIRGGLRCLAVELSLQGDRRWTFDLARDVKSGD
jgi:hypothetical protein